MFVDFVLNSQGHGQVGQAFGETRFDPGLRRPYLDDRGHRCVDVLTNKRVLDQKTRQWLPVRQKVRIADLQSRGFHHPVLNAATLTKQAWQQLDDVVVKATRQRLRAWADLAASSSVGGFDAMSKLTFEYQSMTDSGVAVVDMDASTPGPEDTPLFDLKSVPLPIIHSDFSFSSREIAVSKNTGAPLDTTMAEAAARRCAEMLEQLTIGTVTGPTYGTVSSGPGAHVGSSAVYGYTNFPYRVTKTDLTAPSGTNPEAVMTDVLEMVETMQTNGFFGPYILYHSTGYSRYLNDDYFRSGSTSAVRSLRERLMEIEGISAIRRLDYLTSGSQLILVQSSGEVAQAINGMEFKTVMWESIGGLRLHFKVMGVKVPLLKMPYNQVSGILHGTTS